MIVRPATKELSPITKHLLSFTALSGAAAPAGMIHLARRCSEAPRGYIVNYRLVSFAID